MIAGHRITILRACVGGALAALFFWACLGVGAHPAKADEAAGRPLVIGLMQALTGPVAGYGQMGLEGVRIAQAMAHSAAGHPLELLIVDTKGEATEAANGATRLATKEKVVAILGPTISSTSLTAGDIAQSHDLPMLTPTATNPMVTQGKTFVFRLCFTDPDQGGAAASYVFNGLGKKKVAVMFDVGQDYSVALAGYFMSAFKKLGGEITIVTKFGGGAQDFSAQLAAVKDSGAELLYMPIYCPEMPLAARQAREAGLNIPLFAGDGAQAPELMQIGGSAVEGLMFTAHFAPGAAPNQRAAEFFRRFDQARAAGKINEDITAFHVLGAEGYLVLRDALERSGGQGGSALRQALLDPAGFDGLTGHFAIGPDGNAAKKILVLVVKDGKFARLADVATDCRP
ncbi:Extracellular ligand-binding receptor [Desulfarculus baarsii DSM 2075]|uniref:Extracellular ligand-binding receptor n=1 Tax=Desulfarculus baarsii (strain ATCC 33931 / DSM 2075 / LMG 7858 / VKM B-1802 / 2st14) TaxID=644282 RepID=E1QLR4_DESB2|nr:ABC transporter substrate-binding protein [Desulfarculus baarsii]ADK86499.1 Extracellular ligand-binding receptor [Desulfarculus baarsii DSM 2075]